MPTVILENVSVRYPVMGASSYSLKLTLAAAATGGRIAKDAGVTVVEALRDVSLNLEDGARVGIVGHNGSGKTTLLRVITGVYSPSTGRVSVNGRVASFVDPMLGIENDATGYENILIRGLISGMRRSAILKLMPDIAEFSGLGDYLSFPVRTYSTGMLMRLAFSVTTAVTADIIVMDEWLSVGDSEFQERAERRLRDVLDKTGIFILASHSQVLIDRECDYVVELRHGVVVGDQKMRTTDVALVE
jgi:lipopolysaccharide transport system ATP-binding protein